MYPLGSFWILCFVSGLIAKVNFSDRRGISCFEVIAEAVGLQPIPYIFILFAFLYLPPDLRDRALWCILAIVVGLSLYVTVIVKSHCGGGTF